MNDNESDGEKWARNFAEYAGVEIVPVVRINPTETPGRSQVQYLFERVQRFEAMSVAMRFLDKEECSVRMFVHAEMWLAVEVELWEPWGLPEGSKRADG
ncbi:hypothetical protein OH797_31795 [Streptomyces anulatus]|uniref:hypothetical protein n=1 Tax=Streptomyces anulatus TaxID=1892 RepID=UPI00386B99A8